LELFQSWLAGLERRHLADLRFSEVTRGLRALSSTYVERRASALAGHRALEGAGKRAALALYYGPLHFLLTTAVLREVGRDPAAGLVVDLGCGTGASGAAAALATRPASRVIGVDVQMWAVEEARATYTAFGLDGDVRPGALSRARLPRDTSLIVVAFVANELRDDERRALLARLTEAVARGPALLVIEPIARRIAPWWREWADHVRALGGRADEWRFSLEPPPSVARLAHAAGLRPEELTARSLWVGPTPAADRARPAAPARRAREARRLPSR
jgi:SAM-dependent methyltransferase